MISRSSAVKNSISFHSLSMAILIISGFITAPFYINQLGTTIYGYWLAILNILTWTTIVDPGTGQIVQQYIARYYGEKNPKFLFSSIIAGALATLIICTLYLLTSILIYYNLQRVLPTNSMENFVTISNAYKIGILSNIILLAHGLFGGINIGLLRAKEFGIYYNFFLAIGFVTSLSLVSFGYGLSSLPIGDLVKNIGYLISSVFLCWRNRSSWLHTSIDSTIIKNFFRDLRYSTMGKPLSRIVMNMESFMISRFISPELASIVNLNMKVSETLKAFADRVNHSFNSPIAHLFAEKGTASKSYIITILGLQFIFFVFLSVSVTIFNKPFVTLWVGEKFALDNDLQLFIGIGVFSYLTWTSMFNYCFALGIFRRSNAILALQNISTGMITFLSLKYFSISTYLKIAPIPSLIIGSIFLRREIYCILNFTDNEQRTLTSGYLKVVTTIILLGTPTFFVINGITINWSALLSSSILFSVVFFYISILLNRDFKKFFKLLLNKQ